MDKKLLTVGEAADLLGLGRSKTYELVMKGQLQSVQIGRARRVPATAVDEFVQKCVDEADLNYPSLSA